MMAPLQLAGIQNMRMLAGGISMHYYLLYKVSLCVCPQSLCWGKALKVHVCIKEVHFCLFCHHCRKVINYQNLRKQTQNYIIHFVLVFTNFMVARKALVACFVLLNFSINKMLISTTCQILTQCKATHTAFPHTI